MAIDTSSPRSRRALLGAAAGAAAATVVGSVARPLTAEATTAGVIYMNDTLSYINDQNNATVIDAYSLHQAGFPHSGGGVAVYAHSTGGTGVQALGGGYGVQATSGSGTAVYAHSDSGSGVEGLSTSGRGVHGTSASATLPAVMGVNYANNTGLQGCSIASGVDDPPSSPAKTGVFGSAHQDATAVGVRGSSGSGTGVFGDATSGTGVVGKSKSGNGVLGISDSETLPAVVGQSAGNTGLLGFSGAQLPASPAKTGVFGSAHQDATAVGVRGTSSKGRGGVFYGPVAQLRLEPAKAATHPDTGSPGDLFADGSGRLWFCSDPKTWVKLA